MPQPLRRPNHTAKKSLGQDPDLPGQAARRRTRRRRLDLGAGRYCRPHDIYPARAIVESRWPVMHRYTSPEPLETSREPIPAILHAAWQVMVPGLAVAMLPVSCREVARVYHFERI
jgi:hypothetical protein